MLLIFVTSSSISGTTITTSLIVNVATLHKSSKVGWCGEGEKKGMQCRKREEHIMEYEMDWDRFTWHDTGANYDEDSEDNFYWTDTD